MSRLINILIISLTVIASGYAQLAVNDAGTQGILQVNNQSQLVKWAESLEKLDSQIQKATDQVNRLTNIQSYMGDPASKLLPSESLGALGSMYKSTTSVYQNLNALKAKGASVAGGGLSGLYSTQDGINLFEDMAWKYESKSYDKYKTARAAADNADLVNDATVKELDQLNDQLTALQQKLNIATTQSEVEKLNGLIASTQTKIAALEARRRAAVDTQAIVQFQNQNDESQRRDKAAEGMAVGMQAAQKKLATSKSTMSAVPGH